MLLIISVIVFIVLLTLSELNDRKLRLLWEKVQIIWQVSGGLLGFILAMPIVILGFIAAFLKDMYGRLRRQFYKK